MLLACQNDQTQLLIGDWQAYELAQADSVATDYVSEVRFSFDPQGNYAFQSTLGYREAGQYALQNDLLTTTDTLLDNVKEKTVQINSLTTDTLIIKMDANGVTQFLKLYRIPQDSTQQ